MRRMLTALFLLLGSAAPEAAPAEVGGWQLDDRAFAHYRVVKADVVDSHRPENTSHWHGAPSIHGFFGHALDAKGRRPARALTQEEWVYLPFALRAPPARPRVGMRTKLREDFERTTRIDAVRGEGEQRIVAVDETKDGLRIEIEGEATFRRVPDKQTPRPAPIALDSARLRWESTYDAASRRITWTRYTLSFVSRRIEPSLGQHVNREAKPRTYRGTVELKLDRVYTHRYAGFQNDVDRAIEQGCRVLEKKWQIDGAFHQRPPEERRPGARVMGVGRSALALLTLLHGRRDPLSEKMDASFARILAQAPATYDHPTYELSLAMMALEARRTPPREARLRARGTLQGWLERSLTKAERAYMRAGTRFLLERGNGSAAGAESVTGGAPGVLRWTYSRDRDLDPRTGRSHSWDNSNTQYAVLGLNAAARCNIAIPDSDWMAIANHWLQNQERQGRTRKSFRLEPHPSKAAKGKQRKDRYDWRRRGRQSAMERGWTYHWFRDRYAAPMPGAQIAYGSMTAGGISSLAIADAHLRRRKSARYRREMRLSVAQAIRDGFAWLDGAWTVWENPRHDLWYLYHLYGLERAGILADVASVGEHDWYWEGALQLILRQTKHGTWLYNDGEWAGTCWAVLFLARSTAPLPVVTITAGG